MLPRHLARSVRFWGHMLRSLAWLMLPGSAMAGAPIRRASATPGRTGAQGDLYSEDLAAFHGGPRGETSPLRRGAYLARGFRGDHVGASEELGEMVVLNYPSNFFAARRLCAGAVLPLRAALGRKEVALSSRPRPPRASRRRERRRIHRPSSSPPISRALACRLLGGRWAWPMMLASIRSSAVLAARRRSPRFACARSHDRRVRPLTLTDSDPVPLHRGRRGDQLRGSDELSPRSVALRRRRGLARALAHRSLRAALAHRRQGAPGALRVAASLRAGDGTPSSEEHLAAVLRALEASGDARGHDRRLVQPFAPRARSESGRAKWMLKPRSHGGLRGGMDIPAVASSRSRRVRLRVPAPSRSPSTRSSSGCSHRAMCIMVIGGGLAARPARRRARAGRGHRGRAVGTLVLVLGLAAGRRAPRRAVGETF